MPPTDEITTAEAMAVLGFTAPSTVNRLVREHKLTPSRKLPGKTGAYLFRRSDVEAIRDERERAAREAAEAAS